MERLRRWLGKYGPDPEWDPVKFDELEPEERLLFGARPIGHGGASGSA